MFWGAKGSNPPPPLPPSSCAKNDNNMKVTLPGIVLIRKCFYLKASLVYIFRLTLLCIVEIVDAVIRICCVFLSFFSIHSNFCVCYWFFYSRGFCWMSVKIFEMLRLKILGRRIFLLSKHCSSLKDFKETEKFDKTIKYC